MDAESWRWEQETAVVCAEGLADAILYMFAQVVSIFVRHL